MQVLTEGCKTPGWEKVVVGLEMGPVSSLVVISYRLPIVTIGLSLTDFAVLRLVTDRRTDGIGLTKRQYALKCIGCQNSSNNRIAR